MTSGASVRGTAGRLWEMGGAFTTLVQDRPVNASLRTCVVAALGRLPMLLIPVNCLAILHAVWNFITFGFFEKPQHRGAGSQVSDTSKTPDHRRSKKATARSPPC